MLPTSFLPAATLGAVGLGEGKFLCPSVCPYVPFRSDMWENDKCKDFGGYLDIWTADCNFWQMII